MPHGSASTRMPAHLPANKKEDSPMSRTKPEKSSEPAEMPIYECLSPIEHDGIRISVGELVEMEDQFAQPLLACGALRLAADQPGDDADLVEPVNPGPDV